MSSLRRWTPAIIWMAIIFFFSDKESVRISHQTIVNFLFFKTLHIIEYAILFVLYVRATGKNTISFILTIVFAITDEIHQTFIPSREGRLRDVIIDTIGALLAWYFLIHISPKLPKKLQRLVKG